VIPEFVIVKTVKKQIEGRRQPWRNFIFAPRSRERQSSRSCRNTGCEGSTLPSITSTRRLR
jgi:hypothetical protein